MDGLVSHHDRSKIATTGSTKVEERRLKGRPWLNLTLQSPCVVASDQIAQQLDVAFRENGTWP